MTAPSALYKIILGAPVLDREALCTCHVWGGKARGECAVADILGVHSIACPIGGFRIAWHDDRCKEIRDSINSCGGHASPATTRLANASHPRGDAAMYTAPMTRRPTTALSPPITWW